jgi:hypothetical protein
MGPSFELQKIKRGRVHDLKTAEDWALTYCMTLLLILIVFISFHNWRDTWTIL